MEKNGKNKIKLTDKVTNENLNSPQFHKWVARILAVCFILMLAVQFIGCMSFSTYASETDGVTFKAGTYTFNDELTYYQGTIMFDFDVIMNIVYDDFSFSVNSIFMCGGIGFDGANIVDGKASIVEYYDRDVFNPYNSSLLEKPYRNGWQTNWLTIEMLDMALASGYITQDIYNVALSVINDGRNFYGEGVKTFIVRENQTLSRDAFNWLVTNTNYNEVNNVREVNIYGGDNYDEIQWTIEYEESMTWGEWYNSVYNYDVNTNSRIFNYGTLYTNMTEYTDVYYTSGYIIEGVQYYRVLMTEYSNESGNTPNADDLIQDFTDGNFYLLYQIASVSKDYHDGYEEGRDVGYSNGYNDGYNTGYNEGETDGYNEGRTDGYNSGYNDGASANFGENIIGGTFNSVLGALNSIIIYQTPNGTPVTIMGIVWGVIGIAVFIWVLKLFVGG